MILEQSLKIIIPYVQSAHRQQLNPCGKEHPWGIIATIGAFLCKLYLEFPLSQQTPDVSAATSAFTSPDSEQLLDLLPALMIGYTRLFWQ